MVEILSRQHKLVAVLENAHNVCRDTPLNALATAKFSLPYNDPKIAYCRTRNYVRITYGHGQPMLYRILKRTTERRASGLITFVCEHVSATLIDNNIDGYVQIGNLGTYTRDVLEYILGKQRIKNWVLGQCDFERQFEYGFDNETLYACLKATAEPITDKYKWVFDTSVYPWVVNIVKIDENAAPSSYFRYGKNIQGITVTEDSTHFATRIKCLGWGEGINQLDITSVNNGSQWLIAEDAEAEYETVVEYVWVDRRFTHADTLMARGQAILDGLKVPRREYTLDVVNLYPLTDNPLDEPRVGDITRCIDSEIGEDIRTIITKVSETDIFGPTPQTTIHIANTPEDIAGTIAEQADRLKNEQLYAQGAKSIYVQSFADNCDANHPAEIDLYIPSDVVNINYVNIMIRFAAFRAYSLTAASNSTTVQATTTQPTTSSSNAGGTYDSTTTGGGTNSNQTSGPSSTSSSNAVNFPTNARLEGDTLSTIAQSGTAHSHYYILPIGAAFNVLTHSHTINHTHTFTITVNAHSHTFSVSAHSHTIPGHSHTVTIPSHTHTAVYGIHEGSRATSATIRIDGRNVTIPIGQDFDITELLTRDGGGKINRGATQQIRIYPNALTRITATATVGLFTGSHAGVAA